MGKFSVDLLGKYVLRKKYYDNRIVERPNQKVFYNGWIDRINRIKKIKENN